jgi:tetratricopeptide (TPR) repeat protein
MMRFFCPILVILLGTLPLHAGTGLKEARTRLLRGNYAEAREAYTALAKDEKHRIPASIGLSKALQSEGDYDQALSVVEAALKETPKSADLLARKAELLYLRGRWAEAEKAASAAVEHKDDSFLGRWIRGQVYRDRGQLKEADEEFRWFIRTYLKSQEDDKEITDPDTLLLIGLAGIERARWHNLNDQYQFILDEVFAFAAKRDKDFWPAEYQSGRLFFEKYNKAGAARAFDRALAINPQAAEIFAAKAAAAQQRFEMKDAERYADRALEINSKLTEARRIKADLHLFTGEVAKAQAELDKARAVNPREEATLARLAACFVAQRKDTDFAALVKEVEKFNTKPAVFYTELAESFDQRKRFDEAEKYYQTAIKLQPELPWAQNGLGMLYMRRGKEETARKILEKAFEVDSFNVRVSNTLKVLDHLDKYETLKTPHFLVRFDPKNDKVLAQFIAKYLEDIYEELAKLFQYRPKGPILIELFNKHEMFSGRVTALPDLHTIGACTGEMVAMVSPRDKSKVIGKPFNWNRVIRHELVHIFNLEQTNFQVPHWLTEGLAVTYEGYPPPPRWNHLLAEKIRANELLNLDTILLGFIRPTSPDEWQLAYLQSQLYVDYLTKTHGQKAMGDILNAYRDGLDTPAAIQKVCKVSKAQFEKGYRKFLEERASKRSVSSERETRSFKDLKAAQAKDPKNADLAAQLAERYLLTGDKTQARKLADEALALKKGHPLAAYVKARLLSAGGETDKALELLEEAVDPKTPEPKVLRLLGKMQFEAKKFAEAAKTLELGRKLQPYEESWLVQLARVYAQTDDQDKLIDVLKAVAPTDPDDLATRRKLSQMLLKAGRHAEAERYAREALEIDVLDGEAQKTLIAALEAQNKAEDLRQLKALLE